MEHQKLLNVENHEKYVQQMEHQLNRMDQNKELWKQIKGAII